MMVMDAWTAATTIVVGLKQVAVTGMTMTAMVSQTLQTATVPRMWGGIAETLCVMGMRQYSHVLVIVVNGTAQQRMTISAIMNVMGILDAACLNCAIILFRESTATAHHITWNAAVVILLPAVQTFTATMVIASLAQPSVMVAARALTV